MTKLTCTTYCVASNIRSPVLPDHVEKKQKKRKKKIKRNNGAKRQNEIFRQIKIVLYKLIF